MGLLNKLFGTSEKIKVQFIDQSTGDVIGISEMSADQLPKTFSLATTMHIQGDDWSVEEAIPETAIDFIKSKSLILKMRKVEYMNPNDLLFTLPTISNELPEMSGISVFKDFETSMQEDDWRQNEFLNKSSFPLVEIEVAKIQDIWNNNKKEVDADFNAFDKCHVRETVGDPILLLDLKKLQDILKTDKMGSLKMGDQFVANGFSIKSELATYYGTLENGKITQLGICSFTENSIDEIYKIIQSFNLIFINWYNGEIVTEND